MPVHVGEVLRRIEVMQALAHDGDDEDEDEAPDPTPPTEGDGKF